MVNPHHLYSRAAACRELNIGLTVLNCLIREGKLVTQRAGSRELVTGVSIAQVLGLQVDGVPTPKGMAPLDQRQYQARLRARGF